MYWTDNEFEIYPVISEAQKQEIRGDLLWHRRDQRLDWSNDPILKELGLDIKIRAIILQALTDTTSKVTLRVVILHAFEIRTGVRQRDGLSHFTFHTRDNRLRVAQMSNEGVENQVRLAYRNISINLTIDCLAFADDLAIFVWFRDTAAEQINQLKAQAAKAVFLIKFEKTEFKQISSRRPEVRGGRRKIQAGQNI